MPFEMQWLQKIKYKGHEVFWVTMHIRDSINQQQILQYIILQQIVKIYLNFQQRGYQMVTWYAAL